MQDLDLTQRVKPQNRAILGSWAKERFSGPIAKIAPTASPEFQQHVVDVVFHCRV